MICTNHDVLLVDLNYLFSQTLCFWGSLETRTYIYGKLDKPRLMGVLFYTTHTTASCKSQGRERSIRRGKKMTLGTRGVLLNLLNRTDFRENLGKKDKNQSGQHFFF